MQVIGLCRFSYPAIGGFQVQHETANERSTYLYASARMEDRFRTFQAFTLPAIRAQTDPDFTLVIVVGDDLPEVYGNRLWDLVHDIPQVVIREYPPGPHREVMKQAINSVRDHARATLQFRLDDDDAVAVDFVARLKEQGRAHADDLHGNRHIAIDFHNGFIASPARDGILALETDRPFMTAALAVAFEPGVRSTVMNYSHVKLAKFMRCFPVSGERMYIRGHNRWNDSRQGAGIQSENLLPLSSVTRALFKSRFAVDEDEVRQLFNG